MLRNQFLQAQVCFLVWPVLGLGELRGFDLTQADFARRIGVSQSSLSAIELGRNEAGAEVLLSISREFGRSIEWLLTGEK